MESQNQTVKMAKSNAFLAEEKVGRLMKKFAIPCVISLLVGALYNIVDQIFIANASYLGSSGNAANTVVFPVTVLALGIAVMIGDGTCAFVSIALGRNKKDDAHTGVGNAILLCVILSLALTVLYLIFKELIISLFGGKVNEQTYKLSKEYFFWITTGIPFYMFGQAMNPIIRNDGSPKIAMIAILSGAIANIILDPVFIFVFKWGMKGAAIATVMGQILTALFSVLYLCRTKVIHLCKKSFRLNFSIIARFLSLGLTSFLAQVSLVVSMAAVQNTCMKYGALDPVFGQREYAQIPLAVLGIVMKFFQIAISVSIGIAAGCIPVVGYNIGANRNDRVKQLFKKLLFVEFLVGAVSLFIVEVFPLQIAKLFGAANESSYYSAFAVKCFRTYLCMMIFATVNKGTFIFLQAMGKALASTVVSLTREVIFGVFLPLIMPIFMGLNGLLWSFPAADILTFAIALIFIVRTFRELSGNKIRV